MAATPIFSLVLVVLLALVTHTQQESLYEFVALDWWEDASDPERGEFLRQGKYVREAGQPSGIKVGDWSQEDGRNTIFVTVPRLRYATGVPASLNTVHSRKNAAVGDVRGFLRPYPDWAMNEVGNCTALQLPMSMAIDDSTGYLYVIDSGRVAFMSPTDPPKNLCPAKIVVLDTRQHGRVVRSHEFPDSVVPQNNNFLNDIVLDFVVPGGDNLGGPRYAYISDTIGEQIVVFDFATNASWSFKDPKSMSFDFDSAIQMHGTTYNFTLGINGIALSQNFNFVYYSAIGSTQLWQVPTWALRDRGASLETYTRPVGHKKSNSDAILMGSEGLYYGAIGFDAICRWELQADMQAQGAWEDQVQLKTETLVAQNWETLQWPDGLALPQGGPLYYVAARAQLYHNGKMDFTGAQGPNYRIGRFHGYL